MAMEGYTSKNTTNIMILDKVKYPVYPSSQEHTDKCLFQGKTLQSIKSVGNQIKQERSGIVACMFKCFTDYVIKISEPMITFSVYALLFGVVPAAIAFGVATPALGISSSMIYGTAETAVIMKAAVPTMAKFLMTSGVIMGTTAGCMVSKRASKST